MRRGCEQKTELTGWLCERFSPELLFVVFMAADHVQHLAWDAWMAEGRTSPVGEVYRILDAAVGRLLEALDDSWNVMLVSDHGGGELRGVVNLNAWLHSIGLLAFAEGSTERSRQAVDRLFALRKHVPESIRSAAKQRLPGLRERAYRQSEYTVIDWSRTKAFAYGTFGNIVINVAAGRRRAPSSPARLPPLCDEIASRARDLAGPDGERIVRAVYHRDELFDGPELEKVPDLIVEFDDYAWLGKGNLKSRSTELWDRVEIEPGSSRSYVGSHRVSGMVALAGPAAASGMTIAAGIEDVAPTVLYLMGEQVPLDLEGRVLEEAVSPETLQQSPPSYGEAEVVEVGQCRELQSRRGGRGGGQAARPRVPRVDGCRHSAQLRPACSRRYERRSPTSRSSIRTAASAADPSAVSADSRSAGSSTNRTSPSSPRRRPSGTWWSSTASPKRASRGTTTGRLPFASEESIEPTPAWVITMRARRTAATTSSKDR